MCASCDQQWIFAQVNWSSIYKINTALQEHFDMKIKAVFLLPLKGPGDMSITRVESSPQASQVKYRRIVIMLMLHWKSADASFEFQSSKSEAGLVILPICCFLFSEREKTTNLISTFCCLLCHPWFDIFINFSGKNVWQLGTFGPVRVSTTENTPIFKKDHLKM